MKHPSAIARDEWRQTGKYRESADPRTLGAPPGSAYYLANRLESAFLEGYRRGEEQRQSAIRNPKSKIP
jgi:hypothetical protein